MGKTNSLWKAIIFPLLIIIATAALQCGLLVWFEQFNKLTSAVALAGTILAGYVSVIFYTSKKMWINFVWISIVSLILSVAGIMFGEAIYLSKNFENLTVWGAFLQILCAIFSPDNVSSIFDKQQFIDNINGDFRLAVIYVSIGIGIAVTAFIAYYIKAINQQKKTDQTSQQVHVQKQKMQEEPAPVPNSLDTVDNKQIIIDIAKYIQNYSQTGDKEKLKSQLITYFNKNIAVLTASQKTELKAFAQRNISVSNKFIAKACDYVLRKIY